MIDYNDFVNGRINIENTQPRNHYNDMVDALNLSIDPLLGVIIFVNIYTAYQMDKNGKNKYNWLIGSNMLNIYLFSLSTVRQK